MNRRQHARFAALLIKACGGLEEAASVCRVAKSQLGDYQSPHGESFMPADVLVDLERYCGKAIYSRSLFEARPEPAAVGELIGESCDVVEGAAALQHEIRMAVADGVITPNERERLCRRLEQVKAELRHVETALNAGGG